MVNVIYEIGDTAGGGMVYNIRSTDFGRIWSAPDTLFGVPQNTYFDMAATGNTFHAVWTGDLEPFEWELYYFKSTDGGLSWGGNRMLSVNDSLPSNSPSISLGDSSHIVVAWTDYSQSPYITGDIFIRRSTDWGDSWLPEQQITTSHAIEGEYIYCREGDIHLAWQDYRFGPDIFYRKSGDLGETWGDECRVEDDTCSSLFPALEASDSITYLVWMDGRANPDTDFNGAIYLSKNPLGPDGIWEEKDKLPSVMSLVAFPNPFNSSTTITLYNAGDAKIENYDIQGRKITSLNAIDGRAVWIADGYSSGVYFARVMNVDSKGPKWTAQVVRMVLLK
jgi:hypothetical protein